MELTLITFNKTIVMAILALIGAFCFKRKIINKEQNSALSDLVLRVFTPVLLFTSFQKEYSSELLQGLLFSALFSFMSFFVIWLILKAVVHKQPKDTASIELVSLMYSNCGFIGIPMAQSLFGSDGIMYMTTMVAVANFLLWSHGIIAVSGQSDPKAIAKVFKSPVILAIVFGILCFFFRIEIPSLIEEPLELIANVNTPMAMFVAGVNIAQSNILKTFKNKRIYWLSLIKLVIIPVAIAVLFTIIPMNATVKAVMVLSAACPVGVTGSLFALKFNKDACYASELFAMTTILSIITIPLIMMLC